LTTIGKNAARMIAPRSGHVATRRATSRMPDRVGAALLSAK